MATPCSVTPTASVSLSAPLLRVLMRRLSSLGAAWVPGTADPMQTLSSFGTVNMVANDVLLRLQSASVPYGSNRIELKSCGLCSVVQPILPLGLPYLQSALRSNFLSMCCLCLLQLLIKCRHMYAITYWRSVLAPPHPSKETGFSERRLPSGLPQKGP